MAKLSVYHDTRSGKELFPLKIRIAHKKGNAYIGLGIRVATYQWDEENQLVIDHKNAMPYNVLIGSRIKQAKSVISKLELNGEIENYSAQQLKEIIENGKLKSEAEKKAGNFLKTFQVCIQSKKKVTTRSSYEQSLKNLKLYDPELDSRSFEDINLKYIQSFDSWMDGRGISQNSRNVYFRNIRAVFNYAIDEEITVSYPFRKFKIKRQTTKKRALTIDELRMLRDYPCEEWQRRFVDMFFLCFYLIGINAADLFPAKKSQVKKGRLEYVRSKTYKEYSIKIEPEAQAIIDKYEGKEYLLNICENYTDYKYILQRMSKVLKKVGPYEYKARGGKKTHTPLFPGLSQYWCRHTWATIAAELDIPKETIAAALGHDMGNATTAIYINFNQKKVDEANRRVIDFLNEK